MLNTQNCYNKILLEVDVGVILRVTPVISVKVFVVESCLCTNNNLSELE